MKSTGALPFFARLALTESRRFCVAGSIVSIWRCRSDFTPCSKVSESRNEGAGGVSRPGALRGAGSPSKSLFRLSRRDQALRRFSSLKSQDGLFEGDVGRLPFSRFLQEGFK